MLEYHAGYAQSLRRRRGRVSFLLTLRGASEHPREGEKHAKTRPE